MENETSEKCFRDYVLKSINLVKAIVNMQSEKDWQQAAELTKTSHDPLIIMANNNDVPEFIVDELLKFDRELYIVFRDSPLYSASKKNSSENYEARS